MRLVRLLATARYLTTPSSLRNAWLPLGVAMAAVRGEL